MWAMVRGLLWATLDCTHPPVLVVLVMLLGMPSSHLAPLAF